MKNIITSTIREQMFLELDKQMHDGQIHFKPTTLPELDGVKLGEPDCVDALSYQQKKYLMDNY